MDDQAATVGGELAPEDVDRFLEAICNTYRYDFRHYVRRSLERRLTAALRALGCASLPELQAKVLAEPSLMRKLLTYLTVLVTEMFRTPSFFRALREKVVPYLSTYPSLKLWVAGCGSGEEAYSLAIVLHEEGLLERSLIYATDINEEALDRARAGILPVDRIPAFSKAYRDSGGRSSLSDHYTAAYGGAKLHRGLYDRIVFGDHCLATDQAFAEVQLVTCRNVLVYFDRTLQDRAIRLFRDSLVLGGFLGLGPKESIAFSQHARDFAELDPKERLFKRR